MMEKTIDLVRDGESDLRSRLDRLDRMSEELERRVGSMAKKIGPAPGTHRRTH
ncbi:MAG: hypothetical protein JW724_02110 [Candidatus Altiarchaeota archaeon]|nr:hypothetical protein [Candidatus Altiarchaeota archaeon]